MILDGCWKTELWYHTIKLRFWSIFLHNNQGFVAHQINKNVLYSAVIARKIYEDDIHYKKEADKSGFKLPEQPLLDYRIQVTEFPFIGDETFIIERVIPDNYSTGKENNNYLAKDICNYIIHSFVWAVAKYENSDKTVFCVASDKMKTRSLFAVTVDEWIRYLKACIEYSVI